MQKQYDFSVLIGRFNPFHNAHLKNVKKALEISDKVIILIGSANSTRTFKNPFNEYERMEMITGCLSEEENKRVVFDFLEDTIYQNAQWVKQVQTKIWNYILDYYPDQPNLAKVALIGHKKDASSWYLDSIPYELVDLGSFHEDGMEVKISSTIIREFMFKNMIFCTKNLVHPSVYEYLLDFLETDEFKQLKSEYNADIQYMDEAFQNIFTKRWSCNFLTVDAVVIQSGRILLIQRKFEPGLNNFALPGGHLLSTEEPLDGCIRELMEETRIKVPEPVLRGSIIGEKLFAHPDRSLRGKVTNPNARSVTMSYCFKLEDSKKLPKISPSDDAKRSSKNWFTFNEVEQMKNQLFDDHAQIISYWLSKI